MGLTNDKENMKRELTWIEIDGAISPPSCEVLGYNKITGSYFVGLPLLDNNKRRYISTKNGKQIITHFAKLHD